jgi:hypothetical protein
MSEGRTKMGVKKSASRKETQDEYEGDEDAQRGGTYKTRREQEHQKKQV